MPVASKVRVDLTDDLDGGRADQTVRFGLDGHQYEIDLSPAHAEALRTALAVYVASARRISRSPRTPNRAVRTPRNAAGSRVSRSGQHGEGAGRTRRPNPADRAAQPQDVEQSEMRAWGIANGSSVSARGRISREVQDAFRATPPAVRAEQMQTLAELAAQASPATKSDQAGSGSPRRGRAATGRGEKAASRPAVRKPAKATKATKSSAGRAGTRRGTAVIGTAARTTTRSKGASRGSG